ncbi:MAG: ATP-binding protein [Caulobacter sp.]|nr:ATP-binding protein [Caulobacter sp.]
MTNIAIKSRRELRLILVLGLAVLAIVLASALGAMTFAARAVDRAVAAEETSLMIRTLERRQAKLIEDIASASVWDDAYEKTVFGFDQAWADENYGVYYATYMSHDRTLAFGADGRVVYASDGGEGAGAATLSGFAADVAPLLAELRRDEARRAAGDGPHNGLQAASTVSGLITSGGDVWMVALATVTPETTKVALKRGPSTVIASGRRIDAGYLKTLEEDLGVAQPHLLKPREAVQGVVVPLADASGRVLGRLGWAPRQPGAGILGDAAVPFLLILAAFLVATGALVRRVTKALGSLAANDAKLESALDDLTEARDRAEAASVAKSQFLANISHEIRTPLNGVLGMAQIMERGELAPVQRSHLAIIRESGATLLTLLNDVLDLAKMEAGKLEIQHDDLDLGAAVSGTCATFMALAHQKDLKLGFAIEPSAAGVWRLDGMRLNQVLANLISNAVKFTAKGHVSVRVWKSPRGLEFAVLDTGAGIPADRLKDLFGKFNQLDSSTTRQFGGTGLGLAICRDLIQLMGGEIAVESKPGEGSYFSFHLPAEPGAARIAA